MQRHRKAYLIIIGSLLGIYVANWVISPRLFYVTTLEAALRPRVEEVFDPKFFSEDPFLSRKRYRMANYLIRHKWLVGCSPVEIRAMLGEPDFEYENRIKSTVSWVYVLVRQNDMPAKTWLLWPDMAGTGNCESWALEVAFDASERMVTACRIFVP